MAYPVTINGRTYTLADFEGTNYVDGFPDALEDFVTQAGNIYTTTSTSSVAIGTGSKTFTVADSGKPYTVGTPLRIADAAAPATNWIDGIVTSYSGTTLVVNAVAYAGSGTKASWNINIGGGPIAYTGTLPVAQGGTGATTQAAARTNLDVYSKSEADSRFLNVSGEASNVTMTGNVTIGDAGTDTLTVNATATMASATLTTADINGGTIDGTVIGGSTPAAISGTTGTFSGNLTVDTNTLFVDAANNRVGIGTTSPEDMLTTVGGIRTGTETTTSAYGQLSFGRSGASTGAHIIAGADGHVRFANRSPLAGSSSEAMRIDTSGNVGIGTSSPGRALDVQTASGDADARIYAQGTTSSDDAILYLGIAGTTATNRINFGDVNDADRGRIIYGHSGDYMSFATAASEAMRIDASGRVGIGTSNPDTPLHVYKQSSDRTARFQRLSTQYIDIIQTSGANQIESAGKNFSIGTLGLESIAFRTNDTERMRIDSSGIVDILGGTVELNGNSLNGVQVTIADDAVAELTFTNRRFGLLNLVEGSNNDGFPVNGLYAIAYVDFGNTPDSDAVRSGNLIEFNDVDTLTGTTGTDGRVTVGTAGTSGTLYIENREGSSRVFNVTLM